MGAFEWFFDRLPDDLIISIFGCMSYADMCRSVARVSRRFCRLSKHPFLCRHVRCTSSDPKNINEAFPKMCKNASSKMETCCVSSPYLTYKSLFRLPDSNTSLIRLDLSSCVSLGPEAWPLIGQLRSLVYLDVSHTSMLYFLTFSPSAKPSRPLLPPLPALQTLVAGGSTVTNSLVAHLGVCFGSHLRHLSLPSSVLAEDIPTSFSLLPLLSALDVHRFQGNHWEDVSPLCSLNFLKTLVLEEVFETKAVAYKAANQLSFSAPVLVQLHVTVLGSTDPIEVPARQSIKGSARHK